ncbi:MAG: HNH endonuclease [Chloroflexi bacterium]|nr:HNH endonuclease [Chloroflexota bacterium]
MDRSPVLLLNQNYQPLNVCDVRRAFVLLGRGKAEALEITDGVIRSAYTAHPEPSIVRLLYMVNRPLHQRRLSRREVFIRDRHTCQYCGGRSERLTLDHVVPRSRGGEHSWTNIVSACGRCNHRKAGRTPLEANMLLPREPRPPRPNPYSFFHVGRIQDQWRPYLPWLDSRPEEGNAFAAAAGGD